MVAWNNDPPTKKKKPGRKSGSKLRMFFEIRYVPLPAERRPAYTEALRALAEGIIQLRRGKVSGEIATEPAHDQQSETTASN